MSDVENNLSDDLSEANQQYPLEEEYEFTVPASSLKQECSAFEEIHNDTKVHI